MKNRILEIINESNYSSVYSFEKITKNQEPLTEKTNAFLSPDSNFYFSPLNPVFSYELENTSGFLNGVFDFVSLRDGILPLSRFFFLSDIYQSTPSAIIVDEAFCEIVPASWQPFVVLRQLVKIEREIKNNELLLVLSGSELSLPLDILENEIRKLDPNSYRKIYLFIQPMNRMGEEEADFDPQWDLKILMHLCEKIDFKKCSVINFQDLQSRSWSNSDYKIINPLKFYVSDSYLDHYLLQAGANALHVESVSVDLVDIKLSMNHGFKIFDYDDSSKTRSWQYNSAELIAVHKDSFITSYSGDFFNVKLTSPEFEKMIFNKALKKYWNKND